jgi:AraC-like DNA-binding protein
MATLDLALRIAVTLQLAALAALLTASARGGLAARLGSLFCASVIAFVVTSAPIRLGTIAYPLTALCVAKPALFWLFAKALFGDGFRVRRAHVAATLALIVLGLWHEFDFGRDVRAGTGTPFALVGSLAYEGLVLAFVLAALHEAWRGLATDLVEKRRRLRVALVAGVAAYLAVVVAVQLSNLVLGVRTATPLVLANLGLMLAAAFATTLSLVEIRRASWLDAVGVTNVEPVAAAMASPVEGALLADLTRRMAAESLYRREGLTIGALARTLGTQEYLLRRVINRQLGYRNFNDFLHSYRIPEACARLRSQVEAKRPVLSIALDLGYNSIGPFNRAFKARTGMTPTEFRRGDAPHPATASD